MGFFNKIGKGFSSIGKGLGKAFGVITSPIKEVWGLAKETAQTVVHMPEKVLASIDKATGVVGGLGDNVERSVGSAAGAVTSVADGAAHISDNVRYVSTDVKDVSQSPIMWAALGLGALLVLRT
jgi:hypothetical protein